MKKRNETGSVMIAMVFVGISLAGMVFSMISLSNVTKDEYESRSMRTQALYVAEAGVAHALINIRATGTGNVGLTAPLPYGPGLYRVTAVDNGDSTWTITSTGSVHGRRRTIQTEVREVQGVFHHAMFAGNSSGDPTYVLELAGTGSQADEISGDIFSGNDIAILEEAIADGLLRAGGTITGAEGKEGVIQPSPDIAAMNYETNNDVDVAQEFKDHVYLASSSHGGTAGQVPETSPAHIFRMNPTDRETEFAGTEKNDYFLEDPFHDPTGDNSIVADRATVISLPKDGTDDGKRRILYYVDGNLWLHGPKAFSYTLTADGEPVLVTFVVKGNIYFSDNLLLTDPAKDAVAFIAIKDENVADSGNILFGDKRYGTLEQMDAYMFAENDFQDQNLSTDGSTVIRINGLMSAGNQVKIDRELNGIRTKLVLNHDPRLVQGLVDLPGIPAPKRESYRMPFSLISMVEVGSN